MSAPKAPVASCDTRCGTCGRLGGREAVWRWVAQDRPFSRSNHTRLHPHWESHAWNTTPQEHGWFYPMCPMCEEATRLGMNKKLRLFGGDRLEKLLDERLALLASEFPWSEGDNAKRRRIS